eukprot:m.141895 g.141895  ORF g.141895 m.141895 type:complete len:290 (+) comp52607_c0_seq19:813-1682(+)
MQGVFPNRLGCAEGATPDSSFLISQLLPDLVDLLQPGNGFSQELQILSTRGELVATLPFTQPDLFHSLRMPCVAITPIESSNLVRVQSWYDSESGLFQTVLRNDNSSPLLVDILQVLPGSVAVLFHTLRVHATTRSQSPDASKNIASPWHQQFYRATACSSYEIRNLSLGARSMVSISVTLLAYTLPTSEYDAENMRGAQIPAAVVVLHSANQQSTPDWEQLTLCAEQSACCVEPCNCIRLWTQSIWVPMLLLDVSMRYNVVYITLTFVVVLVIVVAKRTRRVDAKTRE